MKRTHLNFAIDCLAFAGFLLLMSTGLLLRYRLPPGSGGLQGAGGGHGSNGRPVSILWDWSRHDWGQIHFWIAAFLLAVLAVHLVLHWKWISCVVRGNKGEASGWRFGLGVASTFGLLLLAAVPLLAPTEVTTRGELRAKSATESSEMLDAPPQVRGSMTLAEVAAAAGLTTPELLHKLDLPADVSPTDQIGPTLWQYGKRMSDVNVAIRIKRETRSRKQLF